MTAMRRSFLHEPPPVEADTTVAARMGLADLSLGPRTGFKGPGAMDWLAGQGLAIGDAANVAYPQANGLLVAKLAPTEALILDPVYTSKALAGLIDHVRSGRIAADEPVVFVHTGGTPAVFAYAEDLLAEG